MIPHLTREQPYLSLEEAVARLPRESKHHVASFLFIQGVRGERQRCRTCPIAVYLTRATGAIVDVTSVAVHPFKPSQRIDLPDSAIAFIDEFDDGSLFCSLEVS